MIQIYPDQGLVFQLIRILNDTPAWRLFQSDTTPTRDTVLADLDECTFEGYHAITLEPDDFTIQGIAGHTGYAIAAPIAFENTGTSPAHAYGYFVTNNDNDKLLAVARFDDAPIEKAPGEFFVIVPVWGDASSLGG